MRRIHRLALAASVFLAGCTAASSPVSSVPSPSAASSMSGPTGAPTADSAPTPALDPTPVLAWIPADATDDELQLFGGARLDVREACLPLRTALIEGAVAAVECRPASDAVDRAVLYLFDSRQALLVAYGAEVAAHGIPRYSNGGRCEPDQASEGGYVPGDGHGIEVAERGACWRDGAGAAHYLATLPPYVLAQVDGTGADVTLVERFAWLGNRDQPGGPTLWNEAGPMSPEK